MRFYLFSLVIGAFGLSSEAVASKASRLYDSQSELTVSRLLNIDTRALQTRTQAVQIPAKASISLFNQTTQLDLSKQQGLSVRTVLKNTSSFLVRKGRIKKYDASTIQSAAAVLYFLALDPSVQGLSLEERLSLMKTAADLDSLSCLHARKKSKQARHCVYDTNLVLQSFLPAIAEDLAQSTAKALAVENAALTEISKLMTAYLSQAAKDAAADRELSRRGFELANQAAKLEADNKKIDQMMREAKDKAQTAMDAAHSQIVTGILSGLLATTGAVSAAGASPGSISGIANEDQARQTVSNSYVAALVIDCKSLPKGCPIIGQKKKAAVSQSVLAPAMGAIETAKNGSLTSTQKTLVEASALSQSMQKQVGIGAQAKQSAEEVQKRVAVLIKDVEAAEEEQKQRREQRRAVLETIQKFLDIIAEMSPAL